VNPGGTWAALKKPCRAAVSFSLSAHELSAVLGQRRQRGFFLLALVIK